MYRTAITDIKRERNLAGGIAPQKGVTITSPATFASNTVALTWNTNGSVVDTYQVVIGSVKGGSDIYQSTVFKASTDPEANAYNGDWTVTGISESVVWVRLRHRYGDGEFQYVDQQVQLTVSAPVESTNWNDAERWNDSEAWNV